MYATISDAELAEISPSLLAIERNSVRGIAAMDATNGSWKS
jgi:hypothetical protein